MEETTALRDALLTRYGVRKTRRQKAAFADWAMACAAAMGLQARAEESGRLVSTRNIVFGDVDRAATLITAHYDTCARLLLPNVATPCSWIVFLLTQALLLAMIVLCGAVCGMLASPLPGPLPVLIGFAASAAVLALMLVGPANPHNANDNSSGVLLLLMLLRALGGRPDVAFVLFDNEEKGLLGSAAFMGRHPRAARRFLLNLDCVGDGRTLLYTGSPAGLRCPQAKRLLAALEQLSAERGRQTASGAFPQVIYPSDQMLFARGTALAALKGRRLLYLDRIHTARDVVLDMDNLELLREAIVQGLGASRDAVLKTGDRRAATKGA